MYLPSSGSKADFIWLIVRTFLTWHSDTPKLENQCK